MRPRLILALVVASLGAHAQTPKTYENSLVIAPLYVDYTKDSAQEFAREARELKQRIGSAPHVLLGFASFLRMTYPAADFARPLTRNSLSSMLDTVDLIVDRASANGLVAHISIISGFFHDRNDLRQSAIQQDVRNAQWFSDGWIDEPATLADASGVPATVWITPSRSARLLRLRMQEGARILGSHLARRMAQHPATLLTISGDGEVELSYERNLAAGERQIERPEPIYVDYSPFMVEEFRDWMRNRYSGDLSPGSDDNRDGRTFNGDFKQSLATWKLRYFDSSGPISYAAYLGMKEKLPSSGRFFIKDGFDAPREARWGDAFWEIWVQFRKHVINNYVRDFATWITTSPDPETGFTVPSSRYYSHQIPADFLFGDRDSLRLKTSASSAETAVIAPIGSTGVTAFNIFDGKNHKKTAVPDLFAMLSASSVNWGIFEYNPSIPIGSATTPSADVSYYMAELRSLYAFRPHVIVPFAWSDLPNHKQYSVKSSTLEAALKAFVGETGDKPWSPRR